MPRLLRLPLLFLTLVWSLTACGLLGGDGTLASGKTAPDFTLLPIRGEAVNLNQLRGRPVLLNFWATWCPPCRGEMPALQKVYETYARKGLVVLTISDESRETIVPFANENKLSLPILVDKSGDTFSAYRIRSIPTTYFIDSEGVIQAVYVGGLTEKQFAAEVELLLAAVPDAAQQAAEQPSVNLQKTAEERAFGQGARPAEFTPAAVERPAPYQPDNKNLPLQNTPTAVDGSLPTPTTGYTGPLRGCVLPSVLQAHEIPLQESRTIAWLEAGECRSFHTRTADGMWVQFFHPELNQRLWVVAYELQLSGDVMSLPVGE